MPFRCPFCLHLCLQLVGCTAENAGRVNRFMELDGCNGRNSSGRFVASRYSGSCSCNAGSVGAACYTNAGTCSGSGSVSATGSCTCDAFYGGASCQVQCASDSTVSASATGVCTCDATHQGADCSEDLLNTKGEEEQELYDKFYRGAIALVVFIEIGGLYVVLRHFKQPFGCAQGILIGIFLGVRSFDMFSDWAFFGISLRKGGAFAVAYAAQGGDPDAVWAASLAFCVIGSLLYLLDLLGFYMWVDPDADDDDARASTRITAYVVLFEDGPQLALNAAIYLPTMGVEDADPVAIVALVMSCLSLVLNCMLIRRAVKKRRTLAVVERSFAVVERSSAVVEAGVTLAQLLQL